MNASCRDFRRRLEASLIRAEMPPETPPELTTLGWHEHLYGCDDCRELLQAEEALEVLLSSLPEPELPRDLAERLLRRLAPARHAGLDALLELDRADAPPGLPLRMLGGLRAARADARLDGLLDGLPQPVPPPDLARNVLRGLEPLRRPARRPRFVHLTGSRTPALLAAAAALLAVVGAYVWWPAAPQQRLGASGEGALAKLDTPSAGEGSSPDQPPPAPPDDEFLASLDLLEDWELLTGLIDGEDVDLLLATLDAPDELLLQSAEELPGENQDGARPTPEQPAEPKRG